MSWIPIVLLALQYIRLLLQALLNPETVFMYVKTSDGVTHKLPCRITPLVGGKKTDCIIEATFESTGIPIIGAKIKIGNRWFAEARFKRNTQVVYEAGPTVLGGQF